MGALLGVPQHSVAELYSEATNDGRLTEGEQRGSVTAVAEPVTLRQPRCLCISVGVM